jgi:beta-lactamase class A
MKLTISIVVIISILLNIWLLFNGSPIKIATETTEELHTHYPYLAKRILIENPHDLLINFMPLRTKLRSLIQNDYHNDFSIYFEYLPTGTSVGVNDRIEFYTASLIKVPVAMAYYHHQKSNGITEHPMLTIQEHNFGKAFGNLWKRGAGTKISADETIKIMLTESDNTAYSMLVDYIDPEDMQYVFDGLDLPAKSGERNQIIMNVKSYSSILKALYFSAIVSKDNSQHILELLTKTKFNDKLVAGIPPDIPVAHKIGTYDLSGKIVFSDCGIVYLSKRSYLLCMASSTDEQTSRERMKTVSKIVYDFVSASQTAN